VLSTSFLILGAMKNRVKQYYRGYDSAMILRVLGGPFLRFSAVQWTFLNVSYVTTHAAAI
jgi:hypothetical protein